MKKRLSGVVIIFGILGVLIFLPAQNIGNRQMGGETVGQNGSRPMVNAVQPVLQPVLQPLPRGAGREPAQQSSGTFVQEWSKALTFEMSPDRGKKIDHLTHQIMAMGAAAVPEIEKVLEHTPLQSVGVRSSQFYLLAQVGIALVQGGLAGSSDAQAIDRIYALAKKEIEIPDLIAPQESLNVAQMSAEEKDKMVEFGFLVEKNGKFYQPTSLSKMSVVDLYSKLGTPEALEQLKFIDTHSEIAELVRNSAHRALQSAELADLFN